MMKTYIGTKLVRAEPMNRQQYNDFRGWQLPSDEDGSDEGFLVEYLDGGNPNTTTHKGYVSWSPKEQFKNAYRQTNGLTFGLAIEAMKLGIKVCREGWNGKGLWLEYHASRGNIDLPYIELIYPVPGNGSLPYPDGARVPWTPSQTDVLADDWIALV